MQFPPGVILILANAKNVRDRITFIIIISMKINAGSRVIPKNDMPFDARKRAQCGTISIINWYESWRKDEKKSD